MTRESEIEVFEVRGEVDEELVSAFARLVPQLSRSNPPPKRAALEAMVASDCSRLVVALDRRLSGEAAIVGTLTLAIFRLPTGLRAWIEDVIVDEAARGKGVGAALNRFAIELARSEGARTVDLTSRPGREAANRLYQRLGFQRRDTHVYRHDSDDG